MTLDFGETLRASFAPSDKGFSVEVEGFDVVRLKLLEAEIAHIIRERAVTLFGVPAAIPKRCEGCPD